MKRCTLLYLLCLLIFLCAPAHAEDAFDIALQVHPGAVIVSQAMGNNVAAAALRTPDSDRLRLCMTRRVGDTWRLVIDNPTAFPEISQTPEIMFDTDGESLFWRYVLDDGKRVLTYSSWCFFGVWGSVNMNDHFVYDPVGNARETHIYYQDGYVYRKEIMEDSEGNSTGQANYIPLKADWAAEAFALASFDAESELVPLYEEYDSWPGHKALEQTARELFPEDTFLGGSIPGGELDLRMLMRRKDGQVVLRCIRDVSQKKGDLPRYDVTESAPLPDNTYYGVENFTNSLGISIPGSCLLAVNVQECQGVWGVSMSWDEDMIYLGSNWILEDLGSYIIGEHPWSDITKIDWASLPRTWQEALDALDTSHYAVVNNPDPADRLHLRALPDRSSKSLGKYYNGTPAKVLETKGDWVHVDVLGQTGWMLRRYLAFGEDVKQVASAFDKQSAFELNEVAPVYLDTNGVDIIAYDSQFLIAGILGDKWYHVWLPEKGMAGYVKQESVWPGNG